MENKYCYCCGDELEYGYDGFYDVHTGQPTKDHLDCPKKDCQHGHHVFSVLSKILGRWKCKKCKIYKDYI
jgi:hypothetical protein